MRYTEKKSVDEVHNVEDAVKWVFSNIILAPLRVFNEISNKVVYLRKDLIEKILVVAIVIAVALTGFQAVYYLISGKIDMVNGGNPFVAKILAVVALVVTAIVVGRSDISYTLDYSDEEVEVEQQEGEENLDDLDRQIAEAMGLLTSKKIEPLHIESEPVIKLDMPKLEVLELDESELEIEPVTETMTEEEDKLFERIMNHDFLNGKPFEDLFSDVNVEVSKSIIDFDRKREVIVE